MKTVELLGVLQIAGRPLPWVRFLDVQQVEQQFLCLGAGDHSLVSANIFSPAGQSLTAFCFCSLLMLCCVS